MRRMPRDRQIEMRDALRSLAELDDISTHQNITRMKGSSAEWSRLRVGGYRAVVKVVEKKDEEAKETAEAEEMLYVDIVGPRGGVYKS